MSTELRCVSSRCWSLKNKKEKEKEKAAPVHLTSPHLTSLFIRRILYSTSLIFLSVLKM
jgi:hypothetical protein